MHTFVLLANCLYLLKKRVGVTKRRQHTAIHLGRPQHVEDIVLVALAVHGVRAKAHGPQERAVTCSYKQCSALFQDSGTRKAKKAKERALALASPYCSAK